MKNESVTSFEVGKFYKHAGGKAIAIIGCVRTTLDGWCFVSEDISSSLRPVGIGEGYATGWKEISQEEWISNFDDLQDQNAQNEYFNTIRKASKKYKQDVKQAMNEAEVNYNLDCDRAGKKLEEDLRE